MQISKDRCLDHAALCSKDCAHYLSSLGINSEAMSSAKVERMAMLVHPVAIGAERPVHMHNG